MNVVLEETARFSGAPWFNQVQKEVLIIAGQGGIGSWTTALISRLRPESLFIYDDDRVETVNLAGQLFSKEDIGKNKVDAIKDICDQMSNYQKVFAIPEKFTEENEATKIMICGFDNMEARKTFFNKWKELVNNLPEEERKNCLYIDGRLSFDEYHVFCITGDDPFHINEYESNYLFTDEEAEETLCSMKQTSYLAAMIGGMITNLFINFVANKVEGSGYSLPFLTKYNSQIVYCL